MNDYTDAENAAWAKRNSDALKARLKQENAGKRRNTAIGCAAGIILFAVLCGLAVGGLYSIGIGGFGPKSVIEVTVTNVPDRVLVGGRDGGMSRLIVSTDAGDFYVDDGPMLGVDNSFQLFSMLQLGKRYRLTVMGRRSSWLSQKPYITEVTPLDK